MSHIGEYTLLELDLDKVNKDILEQALIQACKELNLVYDKTKNEIRVTSYRSWNVNLAKFQIVGDIWQYETTYEQLKQRTQAWYLALTTLAFTRAKGYTNAQVIKQKEKLYVIAQ